MAEDDELDAIVALGAFGEAGSALGKTLASMVLQGKITAKDAQKLLSAASCDAGVEQPSRSAGDCLDAIRSAVGRTSLPDPPVMMVASANDWGRIGGGGSIDDCHGLFAVGRSKKYVGVLLAVTLDRDGPPEDEVEESEDEGEESEDEAEDEADESDDEGWKTSFDLTVVAISEREVDKVRAARDGGCFDQRELNSALRGAIIDASWGDGGDTSLVRLSMAADGDGDVRVRKLDRAAGNRLMRSSRCGFDFDSVVARAIKQLAGHHAGSVREAFMRTSGIPTIAVPLYEAYRSIHSSVSPQAKAKGSAKSASKSKAKPKAKPKANGRKRRRRDL